MDSGTPNLHSLVDSAQQAISRATGRSGYELPYAVPDRRANPRVESLDRLRAGLFVLAAVLFTATAWAFTPSFSGQLLDTGRVQAFALPFLGACLIASSLFALLPHQLSARRQRAVSVCAAAAAATLGCALTLAAGFLPWSAAVLALASCAASLYGVRQLNSHTARTTLERLCTDAPLSLMAGFGLVFTAQLGFAAAGWTEARFAPAALLVVLLLSVGGSVAAHSERGRHAFALGLATPLAAMAVLQRLHGSGPWWLSAVTVLGAVCVVVAAENRRHQLSHAEHLAARGKPLHF